MKRMVLAAVAAFGLIALAQANGPIQGQVAGGCSNCQTAAGPRVAMPGMGGCPECAAKSERAKKFGLNPLFTRLMFWKKDNDCGTCGVKGKLRGLFGNCGGCGKCADCAGGGFNPYPNGVPGTLVFPQNPYIRSPRDWYEK